MPVCQKIDRSFFSRLSEMGPEDVCRRTGAVHDPATNRYRITVFGRVYEVDPTGDIHVLDIMHVPDTDVPYTDVKDKDVTDMEVPDIDAAGRETGKPPLKRMRPVSVELGLVILFYLLEAQDIPVSDRWINEFSLKGGALFFRGPHAIRNHEIAARYGRDPAGFEEVCTRLGGRPIHMGDAAFRFQALPRIPLVVVLWYGDEEFEASAKLLMDSTIDSHLPLDVIYALGVELVDMLTGCTEEV
jgi:hypothetical protein